MSEYINETEVLQRALDTYGSVPQIAMVFEEMSELQKELCKHLRGSGSQENIAEEIADVEIMIEQMKMLFNCEAAVLQVREKKVKRLKERIEQNGLDVSENASSKKQLIDANALIKEANADGAYGYVDAKQIADAPTVDAVEVVRCKDCKYWQDNNDGYPHEECRWVHEETPDADDFCSYGERKEGDK